MIHTSDDGSTDAYTICSVHLKLSSDNSFLADPILMFCSKLEQVKMKRFFLKRVWFTQEIALYS